MAVKVNPPPALRIPKKFLVDPESKPFFEQMRTILFQLWKRTGGGVDLVAGQQIIISTSGDIVLDSFGALIVIDASSEAVELTLPVITQDNVGESIDIAIIDATFDTTVSANTGATVFGEDSVVMAQQFMSIQYTAVSTGVWIGT